MDTFLTISLGAVFVLWVLAAVVYPFMEECEQSRFNKNNATSFNKNNATSFNKNDVKYTDGDNT